MCRGAGDAGNSFAGSQWGCTAPLDFIPAQSGIMCAPMWVPRLRYRAWARGSRPPAWLPHQHVAEPARLALLCESREGYQNLSQLVTRFKMRETTKQEGAANFGDLQRHATGLVCMTGGDEGPLAAALMRGGEEAGREAVERLVHIFWFRKCFRRTATSPGARRGVEKSGRHPHRPFSEAACAGDQRCAVCQRL